MHDGPEPLADCSGGVFDAHVKRMSAEEALSYVRARRKFVFTNERFVEQLRQYDVNCVPSQVTKQMPASRRSMTTQCIILKTPQPRFLSRRARSFGGGKDEDPEDHWRIEIASPQD